MYLTNNTTNIKNTKHFATMDVKTKVKLIEETNWPFHMLQNLHFQKLNYSKVYQYFSHEVLKSTSVDSATHGMTQII